MTTTMPPPTGTAQRACWDFVSATVLGQKLRPSGIARDATPGALVWESNAPPRRIGEPGRPVELHVTTHAPRTPGSLVRREARARLVHTFLHHELQAAELFAWAVLAFPSTPIEFRRGLVGLCREELAHLALYAQHLERLGARVGDYEVRDWFWERVPSCETPTQFVALLGLGLEAANLEHAARFAERFRAAGDDEGAGVLERVEREEVAHVAFAARWFREFTGAGPDTPLDYARWSSELPDPLTPAVLRGKPLNRASRARAGFDEVFLARLEAEPPTTGGRGR